MGNDIDCPSVSDRSISVTIGNTFRVTDMALYTSDSSYYGEDSAFLHIRMQRSSWLPAVQYMQYNHQLGYGGIAFYAEDSLGNHYDLYHRNTNGYASTFKQIQGGIFTCNINLWINDFQGIDADWIDICYQRDGYSESMRIYLTGGADK